MEKGEYKIVDYTFGSTYYYIDNKGENFGICMMKKSNIIEWVQTRKSELRYGVEITFNYGKQNR